jgi:hypothetical protein
MGRCNNPWQWEGVWLLLVCCYWFNSSDSARVAVPDWSMRCVIYLSLIGPPGSTCAPRLSNRMAPYIHYIHLSVHKGHITSPGSTCAPRLSIRMAPSIHDIHHSVHKGHITYTTLEFVSVAFGLWSDLELT